ncbi:MAG: hypothetical protein EPO08_20735 [Rhodospirillaceae bacterium]|nr:MAG: hypothetical protein EPO08_20735 [Rhodospirillaceae bacterium]
MAWRFFQTGKLFTPSGAPAAHEWYSGHGSHANVPEDEGLLALGPLPRGHYALSELIRNTAMGPVAIHLLPDAATRARIIALGRDPDSFFAHDDDVRHDHLASAGCLVSVDGMMPLISLWEHPDHDLNVLSGETAAFSTAELELLHNAVGLELQIAGADAAPEVRALQTKIQNLIADMP